MGSIHDTIELVKKKSWDEVSDAREELISKVPEGHHLHETPRDGNCQFHSIAAAINELRPDAATPQTARLVRARVVAWLRDPDNRTSYDNLLARFGDEDSKEGALATMERDGEWGDDITLEVASRIYRVKIKCIFSLKNAAELTVGGEQPFSDTIRLAHWYENHWDAVLPGTAASCTTIPVHRHSICAQAATASLSFETVSIEDTFGSDLDETTIDNGTKSSWSTMRLIYDTVDGTQTRKTAISTLYSGVYVSERNKLGVKEAGIIPNTFNDVVSLRSKRAPVHVTVCIDIGAVNTKIALLDAYTARMLTRRLFDTVPLLKVEKVAPKELLRAVTETGEAVFSKAPDSFADFDHVLLAVPGFLKKDGKIHFPLSFRDGGAGEWTGNGYVEFGKAVKNSSFVPGVLGKFFHNLTKGLLGEWKDSFFPHDRLKTFVPTDAVVAKRTKWVRNEDDDHVEERTLVATIGNLIYMNTRTAAGFVYRRRNDFEDGIVLTLGCGPGLTPVILDEIDTANVAAYNVKLHRDGPLRECLSAKTLNAMESDAQRTDAVLKAIEVCIAKVDEVTGYQRSHIRVEVAGGMAMRLDQERLIKNAPAKGVTIRVVDKEECVWNDVRGLQTYYEGNVCHNTLKGAHRYTYDPNSKPLGKGTYGKVFKAMDKRAVRVVAMKRIDLDHVDADGVSRMQDYLDKSVREMHLMKAATHSRYVMPLHECYVEGSEFVMIMPLYTRSLSDEMKVARSEEGPDGLSEARVKEITRCVLAGLTYLHSVPMTHRDLKPDNLMVELDNTVVLADFGETVVTKDATPQRIGGSLPFLPPECAEALQQPHMSAPVTPAQDMWALGILIIYVLEGHDPRGRVQTREEYETILRSGTRDGTNALTVGADYVTDNVLSTIVGEVLKVAPNDRASAKVLLEAHFPAELVVEYVAVDSD